MRDIHIVIYAKAPVAGFAKTRLIPELGPEGAAQLAERLLQHTLKQAIAANVGTVELCGTPDWADAAWQQVEPFAPSVIKTNQVDGDLGVRLVETAQRVVGSGKSLLVMGTDCPGLDAVRLRQGAEALSTANACLQPVADGGYGLLALNQFHPYIFENIPWSSKDVASETRQRIKELGWRLAELPLLHDIDEPEDLKWLPQEWPEWADKPTS